MARFKRKAHRFGGFRKGRRSHRRSGGNGVSLMGTVLPAVAYGAARPYVSNLVSPVTNMLGAAGGYADNLVLGGIGYFAAKKGRGFIKNAGHAMLMIEAAQIGAELSQGFSGGSTGGAF
jgi:hypothetical protein